MEQKLLEQFNEWENRKQTYPPQEEWYVEGISILTKLKAIGCVKINEYIFVAERIQELKEELDGIRGTERK